MNQTVLFSPTITHFINVYMCIPYVTIVFLSHAQFDTSGICNIACPKIIKSSLGNGNDGSTVLIVENSSTLLDITFKERLFIIALEDANVEEFVQLIRQEAVIGTKSGRLMSWNGNCYNSSLRRIDSNFFNFRKNYTGCRIVAAWELPQDVQKIPNLDRAHFKFLSFLGDDSGLEVTFKDYDVIYHEEYHHNGTRQQLLADLEAGKFDLFVGSLMINTCSYLKIGCTSSTYSINFKWIYPKLEIPHWQYILRTFTLNVWLLLAFTVAISSIVTSFVLNETIRSSAFLMFKVIVTGAFSKRTPNSIIKVYSGFVLTFGFCVTSFYVSQLSSILLTPLYAPKITTDRQLLDSNIEIRLNKAGKFEMRHEGLETSREIADKAKNDRNDLMTDAIEGVIRHIPYGSYATVTSHYALLKKEYYWDYIEAYQLKVMPVVYFTRHNYPLLNMIGRYIEYCQAFGLFEYWINYRLKKPHRVKEAVATNLNFDHLEGAFYALSVGLTLSFCVFVVEIMHTKMFINGS